MSRHRAISDGARFRLLMGKVRRFFYIFFRPGYVEYWRARRRGSCRNCGACCQLAHRCPHLKRRPDGSTYCAIYPLRPPNCRAFPIDPQDLRDRDIIMPQTPCGFYFEQNGHWRRR